MTNRHGTDPFTLGHELTPEDLLLKPQKKHHKREYIASEHASEEPDLLLTSSRHRHRRKKKHTVRNVVLIVLACLLGIVLIAVLTVLFLQSRGRHTMFPDEPVTIVIPEEIEQDPAVEVTDNGRTVKYNGDTYVFNENRTNILCLGIDKTELGIEGGVVGTGGQADAIVVLSVDTATGEMDALAISRDSLVDIDLFAEDGSFAGTEKTQICLSYAYGDGREQSCEATTRAVSRLLYGIPINTYFAMDISNVATLNDAIGGVEVTLLSDLQFGDVATYSAGERHTLLGQEALWYIQMRDTEQLASNNERMERQKQYLAAFADKVLASTKENLQIPLILFNTVSDEAITSLTPSKITFLATSLVRHNQPLRFASVAGEVVKGEDGYAEFHVDDKALYEQVLDIFYTKQ